MSEKRRVAIIGGSESGKSFRAMGYSRGLWKSRGLRSLVFDPWKRDDDAMDWGPQAMVFDVFEQWKNAVLKTKGFVAIWDEATGNGGRDQDNVGLFTEIRHNHPVLLCIAHAWGAILPNMRVNLTDLVIASADDDDAGKWARTMKDAAVCQAIGLPQYHFLHKRNFQPVRIVHETAEQVRAGLTL